MRNASIIRRLMKFFKKLFVVHLQFEFTLICAKKRDVRHIFIFEIIAEYIEYKIVTDVPYVRSKLIMNKKLKG